MWRLVCALLLCVSVSGQGSFAHITDLHYDSSYRAGASTLGYCRTTDAGTSGKFGAQGNRCDSPQALIRDVLVLIATRKPTVDFVLVTGDLARRNRNEVQINQTEQLGELQVVSQDLLQLVADPLPVIPSIGGSDLWPESECVENDPQFAMLLNSSWSHFLRPWMDERNHESFLRWGCYNVTINGFGIIVFNTEFWSNSNSGMDNTVCAVNPDRLGKQIFNWAESILEGYKAAGMKVLLTGNRRYFDESGGDNGYRLACANHYMNMSTVWEDTILGHVFGGAHEDSFYLIENKFDVRTQKNFSGVVFGSPAVVPVKNPSFRIYEYARGAGEKPNGTLTDYMQFYANILQANAAKEITWLEEYRATSAYELPDLSTNSWLNFFNKLETDPAMKRKYEFFKGVSSESTVPTPAVVPPDTIIGVVFSVTCGVIVILAGILAWWKCRSFKYKTYEQELAEGLR